MAESTGHEQTSRNPLPDPVTLDLSDDELLSLIRGVKVDVHELNIRIGVGGRGARQLWNVRRKLEFITKHKVLPKKDES